jgi:hypothetical protein
MFGPLHAAVCTDSVLQWLRRAYYAGKHSVDGDTSRLPELATALRHVFIVSGVQLLAKATSFHVAPGDIIKTALVSFVLFITDMNNCCLFISAPGKTGSSIKITTNKKGGHSWPPLGYTLRITCIPGTLPCIPGNIPALPVLAVKCISLCASLPPLNIGRGNQHARNGIHMFTKGFWLHYMHFIKESGCC